MTSRHDQQARKICDFGMTPVTSSSLVPTSTTHESHTRVELRARFRFSTHGRDRQKTGNHRAQRAPQQGAEEKNSTALRYHVCRVSALCPARNFRSRSNQTMGCAHMDVIVHVVLRLYTRCQRRLKKTESNTCSAVAMWMVRHKQKQFFFKIKKLKKSQIVKSGKTAQNL